jgi:hypothetical protein
MLGEEPRRGWPPPKVEVLLLRLLPWLLLLLLVVLPPIKRDFQLPLEDDDVVGPGSEGATIVD